MFLCNSGLMESGILSCFERGIGGMKSFHHAIGIMLISFSIFLVKCITSVILSELIIDLNIKSIPFEVDDIATFLTILIMVCLWVEFKED